MVLGPISLCIVTFSKVSTLYWVEVVALTSGNVYKGQYLVRVRYLVTHLEYLLLFSKIFPSLEVECLSYEVAYEKRLRVQRNFL